MGTQLKQTFIKKKQILCSKMNKGLRVRLIKTLVWPVMLYGSETWTMRKDEKRRIEAFEMWCWRKMEGVSYRERKTNEEVLGMVGQNRALIEVILERKKNWMGHVLRGDGLMLEVMEARMEGKARRGRKRIGMLKDVVGASYVDMKRKAQKREFWRIWRPWACLTAEN